MMGLTLVAMLVMAVGASSAFASEFTLEGGGSIAGVTFSGVGTIPPEFETSGGAKVTCEKSESTGKVLNSKEAETVATFTESTGKKECEINGGLAGHATCGKSIVTEKLTIEPVEIGGTGSKRGVVLSNKKEEKGVMAKFTCTGTVGNVVVKGRLVCESKGANVGNNTVYENKGEVVCEKGTKAGEQLFTKITNSSEVFELKAEAGTIFKLTEKDAQITTEKLMYSANVKQT
jgi:hypothetical protein